MKKLFIAACILSAFPLTASAAITATASASPIAYSGSCPGVITFKGKIKSTGRTTVRYRWIRSDGASAPIHSITFAAAGTKTVTTTWTLGGASLPTYSGWEAVKILVPVALTSNKAKFTLKCH